MTFERSVTILGCRDVPRSAEWFRDVLGFHLDPEIGLFGDDPDEGPVYAIVDRDGVNLHLQIRRLDLPAGREEIETDAYFYVTDVDALYAELKSTGVLHPVSRDGISTTDFGTREFATLDRDGNLISFFRWE